MKLAPQIIDELCQLARIAAIKAGKLIQEQARNILVYNNKSETESPASQVVTQTDHQSQNLILNQLNSTLDRFDLGLLSEELPDKSSRQLKDYFWCIDPLDGTLPYTESRPGYAVSIALVSRSGIPVIGVVLDPVNGNLYHAIKNKGAFKNGNPFKINPEKNTISSFVIDRSFKLHSHYDSRITAIKKALQARGWPELKIVQAGGAVMNAIYVLENSPAFYLKLPQENPGGGSLWDFAATTCIFGEARAMAADSHGNPLDLNRNDSTFMNHRGILFTSDIEIAQLIVELNIK